MSKVKEDKNRPFEERPDPITIEGEEEYEVEAIVDSKRETDGWYYRVKWKGYGPEENTWEPLSNLTHAQDLVSEFHHAHPQAPRNIGRAFLQIPFRVNPSLVVEDSP